MLYAILNAVHVLSIVIWVGGMVFAQFCLRPAVATLPAEHRPALMHEVLRRFFGLVSIASLLAVGSGVWMLGRSAKQVVQSGGQFGMPLSWTVMATLGLVMLAIYGHIRMALFKRFGRAVAAKDASAGAAALGQIRTWVSVNLVLGLVVIVVAVLRWPS